MCFNASCLLPIKMKRYKLVFFERFNEKHLKISFTLQNSEKIIKFAHDFSL